MHELAIAESIVGMIEETVGARRVRRIALEIGAQSCVSPEALLFSFHLVAEGSASASAILDIAQPPGDRLIVKYLELEEAA